MHPGKLSKEEKKWAFERWRICRIEWTGVRLVTARISAEYLQQSMPMTMACLDTGERTYVNIAVALPLSGP